MEATHRKANTVKNVSVDIIAYFVTVILRFVVRYAFIYKIGTEYLGLNSVFTSIISMFSLAEMGFNLTVGAMLYKPISENNVEKIKSLIKLTKKVFYTVGFIVLFGGSLIIPFIQFFVSNSTIGLASVRCYYFLHVLSSSVSYFFTHKIVLVSADQKQYVYKRITTIFNIIMSFVQVVLLFILENYISFLIAQLIFTIFPNIVLSVIADKMYPYLKERNVERLTAEEKKEFYKKSFGAFFYKMGSILVSATDSILISSSAILGVVVLGKYSNYTLIFTSISQLAYLCVSGAIASIGNLWVTADKDKVMDTFKKLQFIQLWISLFCTASLCALSQPVISLLGEILNQDLTLTVWIVVISSLNFYLQTMQTIVNLFKNAKGLFWYDRYKAIIEAVVNLVASLILMQFMGIIGVLLGTTISIVFVNVWYEPYVLYKHGFDKEPMGWYMKNYVFNFILTILVCGMTFGLTYILPMGVGWLCVKCLICLIVPNLSMIIIFRKTNRFKYCANLIKSIVKRQKNTPIT